MIAGEASGDLHASTLALALRNFRPHIELFGAGGKRMRDAGVRLEHDLTEHAVVGFTEVFQNLSEFKKIFDDLSERCAREKPDAVILVDYPGFNLRFAKVAKKMRVRVVYYISPQVWAWGSWRIPAIRERVDQMIVVFAFEELFYKRYDIKAHFVGHPLLDLMRPPSNPKKLRRELEISDDKTLIGLLPGSREKEVSTLLPIMVESARLLQKELPNLHFLVFKSPTLSDALYKKFRVGDLPVAFVEDTDYQYRSLIDFSLVASGTATLENAIFGKPMVILYKVSPFTSFLVKRLIQLPYIGLVNVVAGERIVPECLQNEATPQKVTERAIEFLKNPTKLEWLRRELSEIKGKLKEMSGERNIRGHGFVTELARRSATSRG